MIGPRNVNELEEKEKEELEEKKVQLPSWNRRGGRKARVVVRSKCFSLIPMNEFVPSTTPSLRDTPPVPEGELDLLFLQFLLLLHLQFIHTFVDRAYRAQDRGAVHG